MRQEENLFIKMILLEKQIKLKGQKSTNLTNSNLR